MKRNLKIGLHLTALKERQIKFCFSNAKLLLDEVMPVINPAFEKCTSQKSKFFNVEKRVKNIKEERLLLTLTRSSGKNQEEDDDSLRSGEAILFIGYNLGASIREIREGFFNKLHLTAIQKLLNNCDQDDAKRLLDEVMSVIKHLFSKITLEKRKIVNDQGNSCKQCLEGLLLRLTCSSLELRPQEYHAKLFSGEVSQHIIYTLRGYLREIREGFFSGLLLVLMKFPKVKRKLRLHSLPEEVSRNLPFPLLKKSKQNKKSEKTFCLESRTLILGILLLTQSSLVNAEDKGVLGEVFPIIEEDLIDVIENKLGVLVKDGSLQSHQQEIQQRVEKGIKRPLPVKNLRTTKVPRRYLFDPSIVVPHDLKDHQGKVFHKAGTKVNPLTIRPLSKPLLFIDGDDQAQIDWALSEHKANQLAKIILTSGAPLELTEKYHLPFYFDQGGVMCTRFSLTQVPARLSQKGDLLEIEELKLD